MPCYAVLPHSGLPRVNAVKPYSRVKAASIGLRPSGFRPRKRHLREGCGLARSCRVGVRMREGGLPRLTGAVAYVDAGGRRAIGAKRQGEPPRWGM